MSSSEALGIALSAATLIVIAATAVAALVQLRHLRASNQLYALLEIMEQWNTPALQAAYSQFVQGLPAKLADKSYIEQLMEPGPRDRGSFPELLILDFWEQIGTYMKHGLVDEQIVLDIVSSQVADAWNCALPVITIMRKRGGPAALENFEYLAVRSALWTRRYPNGAYPAKVPRMADLAMHASDKGTV